VSTALHDHGLRIFASCVTRSAQPSVAAALTPVCRLESFVLICAMFMTIYFQTRWLNVGLQYFDALVRPVSRASSC
jgi:hypothetical protein